MSWYNPLSWFTTPAAPVDGKTPSIPGDGTELKPGELLEAEVLDAVTILEDGKQSAVDVVKDGIAPEDKYLFEVVVLAATDEVMHIVPKGETESPLCCSDRKPPFEVHEALLTLEQAARLKQVSKSAGGDGNALVAEEVQLLQPVEEPEPIAIESFFRADALARAKPVLVKKD